MNKILDDIIEIKKKKVFQSYNAVPVKALENMASTRARRDFKKALVRGSGVNIIAEIKRASPSAGIISDRFDPAEIAFKYSVAGAAAISVLTEEKYFKGSISYLEEARKNSSVPILRKDFIVDIYQLYEAAAYGADAALLIARILEPVELRTLVVRAKDIGICPLVEVHNETELEYALKSDADIIGVNNRDLNTLEVNINTALELIDKIPKDKIIVVESGIKTRRDIEMYTSKGVNSFLIGETLMRSADIASAIRGLKAI